MSKKKDLQKKTRKASRRQIEQLAAQIADEMAVGLFGRTEKYAANVGRYYSIAVGELLKLTAGVELDPESEVFSFSGSKRMSEKSNAILRGLYSAVYQEIRNGVVSEWENANAASDRLVELVLGKGVRDDKRFASLFARNREAMDAFFSRKNERGGLNLSQKVWKYTSQFKDEMELALSASLGRGDSAATVSRRVRQYLQEPERLFRRVRDEEGNLKLSKKAAAYHPGQGQYRSSYKNAMRLARTETNMAYRSADYERRQRHPWIVGMEVKRVHDKTVCKLCDELAGVYPKDFKFVGWHPQCRCYTIDVLAPADEVDAYHRAMLNGEDVSGWQFSGQITEPHEGFREWMKENAERMEKAAERGTLPYWVKDNPQYMGVKQAAQAELVKNIHSTTSNTIITPETDRAAFRQLQKETLREIGENGKIDINNRNLYTSHLYCAKADRKELIGHCYDYDELEALKNLASFVQDLKNGRYVPIDMSRDNYKAKIAKGVLHFTAYDVDINGMVYEFKCMAIKLESEKNGRVVIEHPYSLKKKKS